MQMTVDDLKNPFTEMYHWCKGEIYDIQAMQSAVAGKDNVEALKNKLEGKKKNTQNDLENVQAGRKTIRTVMKNQNDTGGMIATIENVITIKLKIVV